MFNNFLQSGFDFEENENFLQFKFKVINSIALVITMFSLIFATLSDLGINELGDTHTNVNYLYACFAILTMGYLRFSKKNINIATQILLLSSLITFSSALYFVVQDEFRIIWFYLLVYTAYILADSWCGVRYTIASIFIILLENYYFDLGLSDLAINSATLGLVIGSLLSLIYTRKIREYQNILYNRNQELEVLSSTDFLTGIMNKRVFEETVNNLFIESKENTKLFSILLLDLDHFKKINDKYGHLIGDEVLISLTYMVKLILKKEDVFARIGGEEFAIVLQGINKRDAIRVAQQICQEVQRQTIHVTGDESVNITISVGISLNKPEDMHFNAIFQRADKALYKAKDEGQNKVCIL